MIVVEFDLIFVGICVVVEIVKVDLSVVVSVEIVVMLFKLCNFSDRECVGFGNILKMVLFKMLSVFYVL